MNRSIDLKKTSTRLLGSPSTPSVILFIVASLFVAVGTSANFDWNYLVSFINSNITVLCICIGEAVVIITGGIDISLGATVSLCNVLLVTLLSNHVAMPLAIALMFLVAITAGMMNGFMIGVMKISPLLTTYATSIIYGGLALVVARTPIYLKNSDLTAFYKLRLFGFIPMSILFVLVLYVMWKLYKHTPQGIHVYAIGANEQSAYASGIPVVRTKIIAYAFAGFTAGMGALAITSLIQGGDPKIGTLMPMTAISAVVIGGVSLSGGSGDVGGGIFGSLFLFMLSNIIVFAGIDTFWQELLRTLILLASIVIATLLAGQHRKAKGKGGFVHAENRK